MKLPHSEVSKSKMAVNPHPEIVNAGYKVIHCGFIHDWVGIGWITNRPAFKEDYEFIPEIEIE